MACGVCRWMGARRSSAKIARRRRPGCRFGSRTEPRPRPPAVASAPFAPVGNGRVHRFIRLVTVSANNVKALLGTTDYPAPFRPFGNGAPFPPPASLRPFPPHSSPAARSLCPERLGLPSYPARGDVRQAGLFPLPTDTRRNVGFARSRTEGARQASPGQGRPAAAALGQRHHPRSRHAVSVRESALSQDLKGRGR